MKRAANRYIQNEIRMASTTVLNVELSNNIVTNDINEMVSDLGVISSDNNSPIVASGRSGFETLTGLVNPTGLGNSLPYPFFKHESRSRLKLGECPQAGCLQGGDEEFEQGSSESRVELSRCLTARIVPSINLNSTRA